MDESKEVAGGLLVPRRDPSVLLEQVDEPLDLLAFLVQVLVVIARHLAALLRRDHCLGPLAFRRSHDRVAVIGLVGDERIGIMPPHQGLRLSDVRRLTRRQDELDRVAQGVDEDVDLRAESAPGTTEGLAALPPPFPAAC